MMGQVDWRQTASSVPKYSECSDMSELFIFLSVTFDGRVIECLGSVKEGWAKEKVLK